jgi:sugar phosphate isomerase/epimerase
MEYSLCSYSFHRSAAAGQIDVFGYIDFCKEAGFTQLDPWMKHLEAGYDDDSYIDQVKAAGDKVGLPFGCIAVDGAHIYEPTEEGRKANRQRAYRWIDITERLGGTQVRIDAGGRNNETAAEIMDIVVDGYKDIIAYAQPKGLEIIIENHWGPFKDPDNLEVLLKTVSGLGLLFDSYNWPEGTHQRAWDQHAKYASITHFKTFEFDADGNDTTQDIPKVIHILQNAGYKGTWGIESTPKDGNEISAARKTLALLKRVLEK